MRLYVFSFSSTDDLITDNEIVNMALLIEAANSHNMFLFHLNISTEKVFVLFSLDQTNIGSYEVAFSQSDFGR